jgi:hypothetical protein
MNLSRLKISHALHCLGANLRHLAIRRRAGIDFSYGQRRLECLMQLTEESANLHKLNKCRSMSQAVPSARQRKKAFPIVI